VHHAGKEIATTPEVAADQEYRDMWREAAGQFRWRPARSRRQSRWWRTRERFLIPHTTLTNRRENDRSLETYCDRSLKLNSTVTSAWDAERRARRDQRNTIAADIPFRRRFRHHGHQHDGANQRRVGGSRRTRCRAARRTAVRPAAVQVRLAGRDFVSSRGKNTQEDDGAEVEDVVTSEDGVDGNAAAPTNAR